MPQVLSLLAGPYASAFPGPGIEFRQFRQYEPGDEARRIDWQVTARRRRPYVRQYAEERELRLLIAMDVSRSMDCRQGEETARMRACRVAAVLALSAAWTGERVGALLFGAEDVTLVPPGRGEKHALDVLRHCLSGRSAARSTDVRPALRRVLGLPRRALVVLLSDFDFSPPAWHREVRHMLAACAARHELSAVWLAGEAEPGLPRGVVARLAEPESGRGTWLDLFGAGARAAARRLGEERERVRRAMKETGCRLLELEAGRSELGALMRFFRSRRLSRAR